VRIAFIGLRAIGPFAARGVEEAIEESSTRHMKLVHVVTVFTGTRYDNHGNSECQGVKRRRLPSTCTMHLEAFSNTVVAEARAVRDFDIVRIRPMDPALLSLLPRMFR
jgi:hypothetical protein